VEITLQTTYKIIYNGIKNEEILKREEKTEKTAIKNASLK